MYPKIGGTSRVVSGSRDYASLPDLYMEWQTVSFPGCERDLSMDLSLVEKVRPHRVHMHRSIVSSN